MVTLTGSGGKKGKYTVFVMLHIVLDRSTLDGTSEAVLHRYDYLNQLVQYTMLVLRPLLRVLNSF